MVELDKLLKNFSPMNYKNIMKSPITHVIVVIILYTALIFVIVPSLYESLSRSIAFISNLSMWTNFIAGPLAALMIVYGSWKRKPHFIIAGIILIICIFLLHVFSNSFNID